MDCFENIIGISEACSDTVPTSGFYLDRIGIGLDELDAYYNKPFINGEAFGNAQIQFAVDVISAEINSHFSEVYRSNSVIEAQRIGYAQDNLHLNSAISGNSKGVVVEICNTTSYLDLFISSIEVQFDFTGSVDIQVWDLYQNKQIDTITVDAVAGEIISTPIFNTYESKKRQLKLAFIYDSAFGSYRSNVKNGGCTSCGLKSGYLMNNIIRARGMTIANTDTKILSNIKGAVDTGGISLIYNVSCNNKEWICDKKNVLAQPILYKSAFLITQYALNNSNQRNTSTVIDRERMKDSLAFYGQSYDVAMKQVMDNMSVPKDSTCYSCNSVTKFVISQP